MQSQKCVLLPLVIWFAIELAAAQVSPGPRSSTVGNGTPMGTTPRSVGATSPTRGRESTTHPRQEPCWQMAGVSKAVIQQRQTLARQMRAQIESVCANSSLSIPQKHEQIRAIHQQERQQLDALISPEQQQAIRTCQQGRRHAGGSGGGNGRGGGPCGSMPGFEELEGAGVRQP